MARRSNALSQTAGMIMTVIAVVVFIWGLERWRRNAAHQAGSSERGRLIALARCLLGSDGATLMRTPDAARHRLRVLAMQTPSEASVTWFDRCVPFARALTGHASEVDNTRAVTAAQTRVTEHTRRLAEAVSRVGLVWRIRAGDPEVDMGPIADGLADVASEIQLAAPDDRSEPESGPVAPDPPTEVEAAHIATIGLEPSSLGTPARFFVGAPLPAISEVVREGTAWHLAPIANEPAYAWHLGASGLVRVDLALEMTPDRLAPLRWIRLDGDPLEARVTPVNDPHVGIHVALDAASAGTALWLAQWNPWTGTVLARFVPGRDASATTLAPSQPAVLERLRDPEQARSTALDERVAITPYERAALVAYTVSLGEGQSVVRLATTMADSERAEVVPVGERTVSGRAPSLEFCPRHGGEVALMIAAADEWVVLRVDRLGASELMRVAAPHGAMFDERLVVRCDATGLVAYGRDHTRESPVIVCGADAQTCVRSRPPPTPMLVTMPLFTTHTADGRAVAHPEWPMVFARAGGTLLAARAVGPVVSVARKAVDADRWVSDAVVYDAAARAHGATAEGLGLYAEANSVTLAVAAPDGLHLLRSDDAGASWH